MLSVRAMVVRHKDININTLSLFLRANYHAAGFKQLNERIDYFVSHGYIREQGSTRRITLTELGKAALIDLETVLRTSHFKFRRFDSGKVVVPGRKKGRKQ